jgi:hypothetical protein
MSNAAPLLIGRRENQIILDKISHGPRPRVTLQVWWAALACAAPDTGAIQATRRQLAEQAGTTETGVSRALSQLTQIGALTRTGRSHYALNPRPAWSGSLASREQAAQKPGPRLVEPA